MIGLAEEIQMIFQSLNDFAVNGTGFALRALFKLGMERFRNP